MIQIRNLDLSYGDSKILNQLNFELSKGSMLGLIGPNGAGKSSLLKVLAGLVFPQQGTVELNETQIDFKELRTVTGYMIDAPSFYKHLSGPQNLNLLKKINKVSVDVFELIHQVGLNDAGDKKLKTYSTGMKQRLAIAAALMTSPELLVLDEPFNGLDPDGYKDLWDILTKLNDLGTTLIISSHLLADLEAYASDFMLINNGEVVMQMSKEDLEASDRLVSYYFDSDLQDKNEKLFNDYKVKYWQNNQVQLSMKPKELATFTKRLVDEGLTPINIKTQTILQQTYFNLLR